MRQLSEMTKDNIRTWVPAFRGLNHPRDPKKRDKKSQTRIEIRLWKLPKTAGSTAYLGKSESPPAQNHTQPTQFQLSRIFALRAVVIKKPTQR